MAILFLSKIGGETGLRLIYLGIPDRASDPTEDSIVLSRAIDRYGVGCSVLAAMTGLTIKFATSRLGIWEPSERAAVLDELIGRLLVRKSALQTLARIFCWNVLLSFAIMASGFITFGVFPVVWIFLNFGVFSAGKGMFMRYTHPWLETAALILSASLGIWGSARLGLLLYHPSIVQPSIFVLILGLHGIAAMLETIETHSPRG